MRADDPDVYEVGGLPPLRHPPDLVIGALRPVVTPARLQRLEQVVAGRTDDLALVLDRIADPHNSSAVLRSAEAFGIQNVHAIVGEQGFRAARGVSKGTQRWLDVTLYDTAEDCARRLRSNGRTIYVAAMGADTTVEMLGRVPRLAIVFGNEHRGVSEAMRQLADGTFSIPMRGFVESLNVSVAAAITMHSLVLAGRAPLSPDRQQDLLARFLMNSVKNADEIIAQFIGND